MAVVPRCAVVATRMLQAATYCMCEMSARATETDLPVALRKKTRFSQRQSGTEIAFEALRAFNDVHSTEMLEIQH